MRLSLLTLLSFVAMAQTSPPSRDWHAAIARGVESFRSGHYAEAEAAFEQAAVLRPQDPVSHLYTGLALEQQFVPGASEVSEFVVRAEREFRRALELDPQNWPALVLLGNLMMDNGRLGEARTLYKQALDLDPTNADIWCTLGAIAWKQAWTPIRDAQFRAMRQKRRMPDPAAMQPLNAALSPVIEQGLADLHHALSLAPQHSGAMEWLDNLLRLRASTANSAADLAEADEWRRKAQQLREEQNRQGANGIIVNWPAALAGTWPVLREFAWLAVRPMAPPPPPPPPQGSGSVGWVFLHRTGDDGPRPMLVNPAAQARNLLTKVDPAPPGGPVQLDVVIGRDGRVKTAKVISGDAAFAEKARAAVLQWTYRPTLSNGEPVEVRTEVDIRF